jgi:phosphorylated CTD-interacting factor 1
LKRGGPSEASGSKKGAGGPPGGLDRSNTRIPKEENDEKRGSKAGDKPHLNIGRGKGQTAPERSQDKGLGDAGGVGVEGGSKHGGSSSKGKQDHKAARPQKRPGAGIPWKGVWNPTVKGTFGAGRPEDAPQATSPPDPSTELARLKAAQSLRSRLHRLCTSSRVKPPVLAFERWLARSALQGLSSDPLLPSEIGGDHSDGLVKDLVRAGMLEAEAKKAAEELGRASKEACERLSGLGDDAREVFCDTRGGVTRLSLGSADAKPYMQVNTVHVVKLRELWKRKRATVGGEDDEVLFHRHLYSLLARYEGLSGHGYQAALAEEGFDVLLQGIGAKCEAFASPLNSRYAQYCSAFPDVDCPFGSLGSFFDFSPGMGSFEANPPFVPEVMAKAVEHIEQLVAGARLPMSFCVIVPVWKECSYWSALSASPHSRQEPLIIQAESHGFCDGAQHQRRREERHRVSSFDTGVFFLQNDAGAAKWRVDQALVGRLEAAMKRAVGTAKDVKELERRYKPNKKAAEALGATEGGGSDRGGARVANGGKRKEKGWKGGVEDGSRPVKKAREGKKMGC